MLVSQLKTSEEILGYLREGEQVFLVTCGGCAEVCQAGGEETLAILRPVLEGASHSVVGALSLPFLCNKALVGLRLARRVHEVDEADSLLVAACGVGIQAVAAVVDKPIHPASDTISLGAFQGVWPSEERCTRCGECILEYTGGVCPLTACAKGLLNGPCGGSHDGMCEVEPEQPCGWQIVYERLKRQDRLDLLSQSKTHFKDYARMRPPNKIRSTRMWALEEGKE